MAPGQSTEDLGQQSRTMRAGEDEESSRGSRRSSSSRHLHQLPAAAGKAAGAECCCRGAAACPRGSCLGLGESSPAKPSDFGSMLSRFQKVREGKT